MTTPTATIDFNDHNNGSNCLKAVFPDPHDAKLPEIPVNRFKLDVSPDYIVKIRSIKYSSELYALLKEYQDNYYPMTPQQTEWQGRVLALLQIVEGRV